ncbi:hypothetical protein [Poseidonocella sp. HB161398]|uniref:hypothetical protein n=1 Tax=Poseidonocella sp. HB161398 TaxID=2320855 RepID=UPI001107E73D|nr:hypothetical protein [Poseidonocella sp. HB161398]
MAINYTADGKVMGDFFRSPAFVRGLQGPIGSGKSVACVMECLRLMLSQEPSFDPATVHEVEHGVFDGERTGKRRCRIGIIRNTTPQLETTTMKTWLEWLPEHEYGPVRWRAPYRQNIHIPMPDGCDVEAEIWFLALDRPEDVKKLLSFEFTFIWLNEARELPREIVTAAISRVKRFPRLVDGGCTRACIIMDTNAPDEEHWWAIMSGQVDAPDWLSEEDRLTLLKPDDWEFFAQPPAVHDVWKNGKLDGYELNPARENGRFTDKTYYMGLIQGQTRDWIMNMLQNKVGRIFAGRPVYAGFNELTHLVDDLEPDSEYVIDVGVDFGLTPAAAFAQDVRGQVRIFDELVTRDTHTEQFAIMLAGHIRQHYPGFKFRFTGDPRGDDRQPNQTEAAMTAFKILKKHGIDIEPSWSNDPLIRTGAVQTQLNTMVEGRPGYLLSRKCTYLMNAKKGGYCYLKDGDTIDKKSIFSHVSDAEQYAFLRMGYGKKLIRTEGHGHAAVQASTGGNIHRHRQSARARRTSKILSIGR